MSAGHKAIAELFKLNWKINAATTKAPYPSWELLGNNTIINNWTSQITIAILMAWVDILNLSFFRQRGLNVRVREGFSGQEVIRLGKNTSISYERGRQHWSWQSWIIQMIQFWSHLGGGPLQGQIFNQQISLFELQVVLCWAWKEVLTRAYSKVQKLNLMSNLFRTFLKGAYFVPLKSV